ncbi:unnamed protein product [Trichogramma brassicae]|uniref:C2H2-type domain-containing protein n=1 Tax=Trichogramma brassicae TaxID=86971 RepID=A0A6H5I8I0_9HYME|nr:unnamed protein product [Trichogramma brassicae]
MFLTFMDYLKCEKKFGLRNHLLSHQIAVHEGRKDYPCVKCEKLFRAAAALVFDVNRVDTFKSLKKWLLDLREKVQQPDGSNIPIILLANKSDIQQAAVTTDQIVKFCKENEIDQYFLCSAKENTNIGNDCCCAWGTSRTDEKIFSFIMVRNFIMYCNFFLLSFSMLGAEEALHFMVAEVLNSKFKQEVRESITLRSGPIRGTKQACCHLM